ncbi:PAS domain S-box-containing protein [Desulfotomaculum arcticum]|uniref:HTH-type transcriptional regulatory protein TyrR n=1 Tax=Desulfotruncus arcticus DSM 17038 TaxID=1121424 RepID=A0A1I2WXJ8_9FIRM|nr:sigma 54-interacting transcriptional regulator [Desulfotruncus arcticus]SFH06030.1 PAS domain S-box-containing protein [Desulfotomaculum arcticum] [Desulfotruncus arcticus DSM 17038]
MRLEDGLENVCGGILMVDASGAITYINSTARGYLNLKNKPWADLMVSDILPRFNFDLKSIDQDQKNRIMEVAGKTLILCSRTVFRGTDPVGLVITLKDIRELEGISEELGSVKSLYQELKVIFDNSYDEIFVTDGNGVAVRVNKVCEKYYGVTEDEIIGKHVSELEKLNYYSPSLVPRVLKDKRRITAVQTVKNGQTLIVTANPVFDDAGRITRIVCNSRDITELTNLQQRLEDTQKLVQTYREELAQLRNANLPRNAIVAESQSMKQILETAERVAQVDSTVLVEGESGVGKGLVALRIHRASRRAKGPYIVINCGAIPENLIESELFGYSAGAFTGANKEGKKGLIEMAHGGTVFLDEISELPLPLQVKILHVIQDKKIMPVGSSDYKEVDIRIIAATNKDLYKLIDENLFREDLYYRLNVVPVVIPPLRHRREDIPHLINHFVRKFNEQLGTRKSISKEVMNTLITYDWPGNVRELENLVERLMITSAANIIAAIDLPERITQVGGSSVKNKVMVVDLCPMKDAIEQIETQLLEKAHSKYKNTYRMAEVLGINQSTVVRKMKKYLGKE